MVELFIVEFIVVVSNNDEFMVVEFIIIEFIIVTFMSVVSVMTELYTIVSSIIAKSIVEYPIVDVSTNDWLMLVFVSVDEYISDESLIFVAVALEFDNTE